MLVVSQSVEYAILVVPAVQRLFVNSGFLPVFDIPVHTDTDTLKLCRHNLRSSPLVIQEPTTDGSNPCLAT
jgi:hypothetical protein